MKLPKPTTVTLAVAKITPRMDEVVRNNTMSNDQPISKRNVANGNTTIYIVYCLKLYEFNVTKAYGCDKAQLSFIGKLKAPTFFITCGKEKLHRMRILMNFTQETKDNSIEASILQLHPKKKATDNRNIILGYFTKKNFELSKSLYTLSYCIKCSIVSPNILLQTHTTQLNSKVVLSTTVFWIAVHIIQILASLSGVK